MKKRIYAIDDDNIILKIYPKRLNEYDVLTFCNGESAIEHIKYETPDLVICDLCMPFLDGYATCEQIHQIDSSIPIVIATALDGEKHRIAAQAYGCHFWHKSADYGELRELVACLMKQ